MAQRRHLLRRHPRRPLLRLHQLIYRRLSTTIRTSLINNKQHQSIIIQITIATTTQMSATAIE